MYVLYNFITFSFYLAPPLPFCVKVTGIVAPHFSCQFANASCAIPSIAIISSPNFNRTNDLLIKYKSRYVNVYIEDI